MMEWPRRDSLEGSRSKERLRPLDRKRPRPMRPPIRNLTDIDWEDMPDGRWPPGPNGPQQYMLDPLSQPYSQNSEDTDSSSKSPVNSLEMGRWQANNRDDKKRPEDAWKENGNQEDSSKALGLGLAIGVPAAVFLLVMVAVAAFCLHRRNKRRRAVSELRPGALPLAKIDNYYSNFSGITTTDMWELERSKLTINYDKKLGSGAFCNVYQGKITGNAPVERLARRGLRLPPLNDVEVAVKMLPSFADDIARSDFLQEINFMKGLAYHPHLVSMLGWVADQQSPLLLVELCEKGDLLHFIREKKTEISTGYENRDGLKVKDVLSFAWQIANGLEYLNSLGCIHRDVAARNVLVDSSNVCKIGDFGLCRLTDSLLYQARGGRLPLKWMAPEALSSLEYSFKSDVWAYGVLLWELFSLGEVPFANLQTTELLAHLQQGNRLPQTDWCTDSVYTIMQKCWQADQNLRPNFGRICLLFSEIIETATESYGYLRPVSAVTAEVE